MPKSTKDYLLESKRLRESISWYTETIDVIDRQQTKRWQTLTELQEKLFNLEKEYYNS